MKAERIAIEKPKVHRSDSTSYRVKCPQMNDKKVSDTRCVSCRFCREIGADYVKCVARAYIANPSAPICAPKEEYRWYDAKN